MRGSMCQPTSTTNNRALRQRREAQWTWSPFSFPAHTHSLPSPLSLFPRLSAQTHSAVCRIMCKPPTDRRAELTDSGERRSGPGGPFSFRNTDFPSGGPLGLFPRLSAQTRRILRRYMCYLPEDQRAELADSGEKRGGSWSPLCSLKHRLSVWGARWASSLTRVLSPT
jgi:hypothetical protein